MPPVAPHPFTASLTPLTVFENAPALQKLVMLALILAILAAVMVLGLKLAGGRRLSGGSPFLSGLRLGGPIIGLLGACSSGLNMTLAAASIPVEPTLKMFAPGIAEAFLMIGLGFLAGTIAVVAHWAVESRIDRQVLAV